MQVMAFVWRSEVLQERPSLLPRAWVTYLGHKHLTHWSISQTSAAVFVPVETSQGRIEGFYSIFHSDPNAALNEIYDIKISWRRGGGPGIAVKIVVEHSRLTNQEFLSVEDSCLVIWFAT